jgi:DNA-binding cell septation regulator SpoVG
MEATFYLPKFRDGKILAFADVLVADGMIVRGFRVVDGDKGLFAAVPSRGVVVDGETRYMKQVTFTNSNVRESFLSELLEDYYRWVKTPMATEKASVIGSKGEGNGKDDSATPF